MAKKSHTPETVKDETEKGGEVAVREQSMVPGIQVIDDADTLAELDGVENAGISDNAADRGTPLLYVAQTNSPQVAKKNSKYVEGMEVGNVFNNLTGQYFDAEGDGLVILPCFYRVNYNEWTPRDDEDDEGTGGFHGSHPRDTPLLKEAKPFVSEKSGKTRGDIFLLPNGHVLIETHHYFSIIEQTWQPIVIPMSSTNLGASRTIQNLLDAQKIQVNGRIRPKPGFWSRIMLKTIYTEGDGYNWYKYTASIAGPNDNRALREYCKEFALACAKNAVQMSAPVDETSSGSVDKDDVLK